MTLDIQWPLFKTEIALIALTIGCIILDLFLKQDTKRGRTLANVAMIGVSLIFMNLLTTWGQFGTSLKSTFTQDGVAIFFKGLFLAAGFFALLMGRDYQDHFKRGKAEYSLLVLFSLIGMVFLASANDFLLFFVSLETLTISLYILTAYLRDESASIEAGVKYLVLGALSTAIFLFGLSFIYGSTGSTSYGVIQSRIAALPEVPASFIFGMVLVVASLGFKIAAVPFQLWAPDVYQGAPTPVTAYLAIGSKAAGFAALVRLMMTVFAPAESQLVFILGIMAALTILYGNLGAIPQTNIKRLLGYSSIGHAGYLLIGLAAFMHSGREAILFYLLSYLLSTGGAFFVLIALAKHLKKDEISDLQGLSQRSPILAAGMLISLFSLAGLPPLAGFFAKFYILWAGIKAELHWLVAVGVLNVITSLYYYLKIVKAMYIDKPADTAPVHVTFDQKLIQYLCIAGILILGIYQGPLVHLVELAFQH